MRNQRSSFIWLLAALVAIECCVVVYFYIQDGRPRYLAAALTPIARSPHVARDRHDSGPSVVVHQPSPTPVAVGRPLATEKPAPSLSKKLATSQQRIMAQRTVVADSSAFAYAGRWEHIAGKRDGRSGGKSSRTFAHGARATLTFNGRFVRLYGILGPGGGFGAVRIDGAPGKIVDFFAPSKTAHRLVYASPLLAPGPHQLTVAVVPDPKIPGGRTQYVNIDGAEYGS